MRRYFNTSLLTFGLIVCVSEVTAHQDVSSQSLQRKMAQKIKLPKGCNPYNPTKYFNIHYKDSWYDRCRDYWENVGPSQSPSLSIQPSLFPSFNPTLEPSQNPSHKPTIFSMSPSLNPSAQPVAEPSSEPSVLSSSSPSQQPTREPSFIPTTIPSAHHSIVPTPIASVSPSKGPSAGPSIVPTDTPSESFSSKPSNSPSLTPSNTPSANPVQNPSASPSISHKPSPEERFEKFTIPLSQFNIALTFESYNRLLLRTDKEQRDLRESLVREDLLFQTIFILLSDSFTRYLEGFYALDLKVLYLHTKKNRGARTTQSTVTYQFSGSVVLRTPTNGRVDVSSIPSETELEQKTLQAFSNYNGDITNGINDATHSSFRSWVISKVTVVEYDGAESTNVEEINKIPTRNGAMTVMIAASFVAILSTLTAFGLIYNQTRVRKNDDEKTTPSKKAHQEDGISKSRKFRSPFMNVTPTDGRKKYFSKLDDESVNSRNYGKTLNPEQSMVDSSIDESFAESLQAPSMTASRVGGQCMDLESLAGMSALDNVRLNAVLQIEDSQDVKSIASNDTGSFRKIWYGPKRKIKKESSIKKLSPPTKDSPAKSTLPVISPPKSDSKSVKSKSPKMNESDTKKKQEDDTNLLEDQSNKAEYYSQNEDSVLIYNMLGSRSMASESSEDIDFNDMYNGDGVTNSSGTSDQLSEYDIISR